MATGILYYDPNTTTAKLATAGLRLAGYQVFNAHSRQEAVELCKTHGPGGDGSIIALLLDAAANPASTASVLKALIKIPGASSLPGILLVSRSNPTPIPGAEDLPSLRRPFSTPALVKVVQESIEHDHPGVSSAAISVDLGVHRLQQVLTDHFPGQEFSEQQIEAFAQSLRADEELPMPPEGVSIRGTLSTSRLDAVLEMLGNAGMRGILTVAHNDASGKLHLDQGRIRLGEYVGAGEDLKLGRFVVEGGFLRDEELEAFIVGKDPQQRPLGLRLVEGGLLSPDDLTMVMLDQARAVTCHLLTWKTGTFTFSPRTELDPSIVTSNVPGRELLVSEALLDGLRRLDEQAIMGPHMPDPDDVFLRIDEQVAKLSRDSFPRGELAVLESVNGRNNVKEIARKTRTGTFAVSRILHRLAKANLVRRKITPVVV